MLICCAKPFYLDQSYTNTRPTLEIVLISSAYYGNFYCLESHSNEITAVPFESKIRFADWDNFDTTVDRIANNTFAKIATDVGFLQNQRMLDKIKDLVALDTTRSALKTALNLWDIFSDDFDTLKTTLEYEWLIAFTDLKVTRNWPNINAVLKYRIYDVRTGNLILSNKIDKDYRMKTTYEITREVKRDLMYYRIPGRYLGLHADEKRAYEDVCQEIIDCVIKDIDKYLFKS
jgi:hypothetical protein